MNMEGQNVTTHSALSQTVIFYAIVSVVAAIIYVFAFDGGGARFSLTLWLRLGMVVFGSIAGTLGMTIGRVMRDLVRPDFIMTSEGMKGLVKAKLFWAIGPQSIGLLVGIMFGSALFPYLFR